MNRQQQLIRVVGLGSFLVPTAVTLAADEQPPALPGGDPGNASDAPLAADSVAIQPLQVTTEPIRVPASAKTVPYQTLILSALALLFLFSLILALSTRKQESKRLGMQLALFFGLIAVILYVARGSIFPSADRIVVPGTGLRPEISIENKESALQPGGAAHFVVTVTNVSAAGSKEGTLNIQMVDGRDDQRDYPTETLPLTDLAPKESQVREVTLTVPNRAVYKLYVRAIASWKIDGKPTEGRSVVENVVPIQAPKLTLSYRYGMYSMPYALSREVTAPDFFSKLSFNKYMYMYDPTLPGGVNDKWVNAYDKKSVIPTKTSAKQTFVLFTKQSEETVDVSGAAGYPDVTKNEDVVLEPGWNLVGNPYPRPIPASLFSFTQDTASLSLSEAIGKGLTSGLWFLTTTDQKQGYEQYQPANADDNRMVKVGEAVWIKNSTDKAYTLTLKAPGERANQTTGSGLAKGVQTKKAGVLYGDMNGDKKVDLADVTLLIEFARGVKKNPTAADLQAGDLSPVFNDGSFGDNQLTEDDADLLLQAVIGGGNIIPGMTLDQLTTELGSTTGDSGLTQQCVTDNKLQLGDVDGDGKVTQADADLALQFAVGTKVPTDAQKKQADVAPSYANGSCGDGKITTKDVTVITKLAGGAALPVPQVGLYEQCLKTTSPQRFGDLNKDGKITLDDAMMATEFAIGSKTPTDEQKKFADLHPMFADGSCGDGKITVQDATLIGKSIDGSSPAEPVYLYAIKSGIRYGDADENGRVNSADVLLAQQYAVGKRDAADLAKVGKDGITLSERLDLAPYDPVKRMHGDGVIDMKDVTLLAQVAVGKMSSVYPPVLPTGSLPWEEPVPVATMPYDIVKGRPYGDANGDGELSPADEQAWMDIITGKQKLPTDPAKLELLDVSPWAVPGTTPSAPNGRHGDGVIDAKDAMVALGMINDVGGGRSIYGVTVVDEATNQDRVDTQASDLKYTIDSKANAATGWYGDATGDGKVNVLDAITVLRMAVGLQAPPTDPVKFERLDMAPLNKTDKKHGDGKITVADATHILRLVVGTSGDDQFFPVPPKKVYLSGDINMDGAVTLDDVSLAQKYIDGFISCRVQTDPLPTPGSCPPFDAHYNINGDNALNKDDVLALLKIAIGIKS